MVEITNVTNAEEILEKASNNDTIIYVKEAATYIMNFLEVLPEFDIYKKIEAAAGKEAAENYTISLLVSIIGGLDLNFKDNNIA